VHITGKNKGKRNTGNNLVFHDNQKLFRAAVNKVRLVNNSPTFGTDKPMKKEEEEEEEENVRVESDRKP
jgi:hypothetical protein